MSILRFILNQTAGASHENPNQRALIAALLRRYDMKKEKNIYSV